MKLFANLVRYTAIIVVVIFIGYMFARVGWNSYNSIFHLGGSSWIDLSDLAGIIFNYSILIAVLTEALGERHRHWVLGLLYVPILIYEYGVDFVDFKSMLVVILSAILCGMLIRLIFSRTLGKMPALEPLKKYF